MEGLANTQAWKQIAGLSSLRHLGAPTGSEEQKQCDQNHCHMCVGLFPPETNM